MNGLTIFSHSLRQVTGNLGMAVRVSGWLVLLYLVAAAIAGWAMPDWIVGALAEDVEAVKNAPDFSGNSVALVSVLVIAAAIFLLWAVSLIAIVWHRYILLEEPPRGFIPYRSDFRIGRYFWYGLGISVLTMLIVGVVSGILGMIIGPFFVGSLNGFAQGQSSGLIGAAFFMGLVIGVVVAVLYLRMALILPAVALEEDLTIGQAWERSSGHTGEIIVLALVLAFINAVVPLVLNMVSGELVWVNLAMMGLYQWFYFMLNISVLSTLYGYIVQKREVY